MKATLPNLNSHLHFNRSAKELETGREVAIKRVGARNFEEQILTKRALRELKLLRHMNGHENVICLTLSLKVLET